MRESTIGDIKRKARKLASKAKSWHFHILTPECQFNERDMNAFVLEDRSDSEILVLYSDEPQMEIGKELVKLLHGKDVVKDSNKDTEREEKVELSEDVQRIIKRAKILNSKGKFWHHHMLFPDCTFNDQKGKWMIVFEDQERGEKLKALFDNEPKEVLKEIETLFYQQKK